MKLVKQSGREPHECGIVEIVPGKENVLHVVVLVGGKKIVGETRLTRYQIKRLKDGGSNVTFIFQGVDLVQARGRGTKRDE